MSESPKQDQAGQPARLLIQQGPEQGREYVLSAPQMSIGRSSINEIVLNDPEISRRHALFSREGHQYTVQDLGSTNGTFVNGQRCTGVVSLKDGDLIEFGDTIRTRFLRRDTQPDRIYDPGFGIPVEDPPPPPHQTQTRADFAPPSSPKSLSADSGSSPMLNQRQLVIGCVLLFLVACCLLSILFAFLDSYNQGQLLYCGGLRPFWETVLGPIGFNPVCP